MKLRYEIAWLNNLIANRQQLADDFKKSSNNTLQDAQSVLPSVEEIENELNNNYKWLNPPTDEREKGNCFW